MKNLIILLIFFSFISCEKTSRKNESHKNGFLTEAGTYYWGNEKNIIIKNIDNESKIFAITDKRNKVIYQQPINIVFSNYHKWFLYAGENQNVYFYNGDYQITTALIWNNIENKYEEINFCTTKIQLPEEFKEKLLEASSNLGDCRSMK